MRLKPGQISPCLLVLALFWLLPGCASPMRDRERSMLLELAQTEAIEPVPVVRVRLNPDQPLPEHMVQSLCREFHLVCVEDTEDWSDLRQRFTNVENESQINLDKGALVGIIADVGQCAFDRWPIEVERVRLHGGMGWLDVSFEQGLYYSVHTAAYLTLVYVPGLERVRLVQIGDRTFLIRSSEDQETS